MSPMDRILERAARGGYGEDSSAIGKLAGIVRAANFESGFGPFICGTIGPRGPDGLHDGYFICPAYGADAKTTAAFKRTASQFAMLEDEG